MTTNSRILRGALLALVVGLCCLPTAHATATCTPLVGGGAATTYNNCSEICCATGPVPANNNDLSSCCHDAATGVCPLGHKCCTPTPAVTVAANQRSRACYAEDVQGCCSFQREPAYDGSFNPTNSYDVRVYFKDEAQCCAAQGNGWFSDASGSPVVPKWVSSCTQYLADQGQYFRCFADGDCPTNTKCCRRPQNPSETTTGQYNAQTPGTCYDPNFRSCCGGGSGIQYGSATLYNQTYIAHQLYNPYTTACCALPRTSAGAMTFLANFASNERCPCLDNGHCPSTNFTCCAPSEAVMQKAGSSFRRIIKCDRGCPTSGVTTSSSSYFQGCYGQCIASATAAKPTDEVCLMGAAFSGRCDNMRILSGTSFNVPTASQLIRKDTEAHYMDCCPSGTGAKDFSVAYNTREEFCCPVVGTRTSGGTRFLSPTIQVQYQYETDNTQQACLCSADSDCPNGQTCCAGANNLLASGSAKVSYGNYTGLCFDAKVRSCCAYKTGLGHEVSKVYNPQADRCCATGVQGASTPCSCHSDAECVGAHTACCTGAVRYGNGTHGVGTCYDTRTQSCCQSYAVDDWVEYPLEDSRITAVPSVGTVFDNTTSVCCKWGGVQSSITDCQCRADKDDCPNSGACCAANGTEAAYQGLLRNTLGTCYNPKKQACCVNKWLDRGDRPSVYDKEKQVCCPNNGVAPDHRSCKCGSNAECPANGECCLDGQAQENGKATACPSANAPCHGRCVHTAIETCCDNPFVSEFAGGTQVKACAAESQQCCDGKCCFKTFQTCKKTNVNKFDFDMDGWSAFDAATHDGYHYGLDKETKQCTTYEHSSPSIVFHTWVFPVFLSVAAILFIAAGIKTALGTDISPNLLKLGLVGLSVFVGIMSLLLLWSPLWKYGFVIVVANTIILSTFAVGGVWPKRFAVVVAVVCFLWVVEPFGSNSILNFGTTTYAGNRQNSAAGGHGNWYNAHGLNYAARLLQRERGNNDGYDACTSFYQYWLVDSDLKDPREWSAAGRTRGICRRSWMHTITVMAGLITPFQTIFLVLAGLALARAGDVPKEQKIQPVA